MPTKRENLHFAQVMLEQMHRQLQGEGVDLLVYLLEMAAIEAADRAKELRATDEQQPE